MGISDQVRFGDFLLPHLVNIAANFCDCSIEMHVEIEHRLTLPDRLFILNG